ncbi:hypothetical protein G5I_09355 [Acromyrmex echinatior]|uniref:Uncharacterized protein n=1 Tax=Acromyrmex echinatior TaxID=103372 RepID=F4WU02_ACREC|nr:hypothetical protein G5I_09355 [Acromyrmex echinatior]
MYHEGVEEKRRATTPVLEKRSVPGSGNGGGRTILLRAAGPRVRRETATERERERETDGWTDERMDGHGRREEEVMASKRAGRRREREREKRALFNAARHFGPTDVNRIPGRDLR